MSQHIEWGHIKVMSTYWSWHNRMGIHIVARYMLPVRRVF